VQTERGHFCPPAAVKTLTPGTPKRVQAFFASSISQQVSPPALPEPPLLARLNGAQAVSSFVRRRVFASLQNSPPQTRRGQSHRRLRRGLRGGRGCAWNLATCVPTPPAGTTSACTPRRRASCLLLHKEESFCFPSKLPSSSEEGTESSPSEARTQGWSRRCMVHKPRLVTHLPDPS